MVLMVLTVLTVLIPHLPAILLATLVAGVVLPVMAAESSIPAVSQPAVEPDGVESSGKAKRMKQAESRSKHVEEDALPHAAKKGPSSELKRVIPEVRRADVRLLLDSSSQAGRLDPENSRAEVAALLINALPSTSRAGIWAYGEQGTEVIGHGSTDVIWKRDALLATRSLAAEGNQRGFVEALQDASWDVAETSKFDRHLIIVSAGAAASAAESNSGQSILIENFADEFATNNMSVRVVVLPGGTMDPLIRLLAVRTGGMLVEAESIQALSGFFNRLTQDTSRPPTIPVDECGFTVEPGLREISVRIDGDDPRLVLVDPDGRSHTRPKPGDRMSWHDARGFDVITIKRPRPGRWEIRGGEDASIIAWGDLALRIEKVPAKLYPGNTNPINFMLFDGDRAIGDPHFQDIAKASARLVGDGEHIPLHVGAHKGGVYQVEMVRGAPVGDYVIEVRIEGPTFARKAAIPFELIHPVKVHVAQRGKDVVAWLEVIDSSLDYESLKVAAQYRMPPNPRTLVPAQKMPGGFWQLTVPKAVDDVENAWSIFGRYQNQKKFELHTEPRRVAVPLEAEVVFGFDAQGEAI